MRQQTTERTLSPAELEREITQQVQKAVESAVQTERVVSGQPARGNSPIVISESNGETVTIDFRDGNLVISQDGNTKEIPWRTAVPQGAVDIAQAMAAIVFFLVIGWPIARAIARYIGRRGSAQAQESALRQQFEARFDAMERNLDTVAIEMEKLSEAQRFTTKLLAERGDRVTADLTPR
ncbi:MAG: hypothetical protein IBJ03_00930 [Gemmatimonadaceae bacterium]|nr:hypothetical protein [Gemmatimonadaceae bacterium]